MANAPIYLNPLPQVAGASWIRLSQGYWALLDAELALIAPKFCLLRVRNSKTLYAFRTIKIDGNKKSQLLHRWVFEQLGIDAPNDIDHKNHNGLDNRIDNLRAATKSQNHGNDSSNIKNSTGYRGVIWWKRDGKFRAGISINYKFIHLGYFETAIEAARAYDRAVIEHFGLEFASTNFPKEDYLINKEIKNGKCVSIR